MKSMKGAKILIVFHHHCIWPKSSYSTSTVLCFYLQELTVKNLTMHRSTCTYELSVNKTQKMMCKKQKMFTETLFKIPLSVIGRCSLVPTSHWLQENAQELTCHRRPPVGIFSVKIANLGSSKWVTGRIFQMSK
jgi:hypothetical protein